MKMVLLSKIWNQKVVFETFTCSGKMMKMQKIVKNVSRQKFYRQRRLIFLSDLTHASTEISLAHSLTHSHTLSHSCTRTHSYTHVRRYFQPSAHVIWYKHINIHLHTLTRSLPLSLPLPVRFTFQNGSIILCDMMNEKRWPMFLSQSGRAAAGLVGSISCRLLLV